MCSLYYYELANLFNDPLDYARSMGLANKNEGKKDGLVPLQEHVPSATAT